MTPLTPEEIATLVELERAATPGPWLRENGSLCVEDGRTPSGIGYEHSARDAAFIVAARNLVPRLLAEREEMRRELKTMTCMWNGLREELPRQRDAARAECEKLREALGEIEHCDNHAALVAKRTEGVAAAWEAKLLAMPTYCLLGFALEVSCALAWCIDRAALAPREDGER